MEKKNTGLKVLVVILTVLVLALGGFIVYDKVLKGTPIDVNNGNNTNETNNDAIELNYNTLKEYQKTINNNSKEVENKCNDSDKNILVNINDIDLSYSYNCEDKTYSNIKIKQNTIDNIGPRLDIIIFSNSIAINTSPVDLSIKFYDKLGNYIDKYEYTKEIFTITSFKNNNITIGKRYFLKTITDFPFPANSNFVDSISEYCDSNSNSVSLEYHLELKNNKVESILDSKECTSVGGN